MCSIKSVVCSFAVWNPQPQEPSTTSQTPHLCLHLAAQPPLVATEHKQQGILNSTLMVVLAPAFTPLLRVPQLSLTAPSHWPSQSLQAELHPHNISLWVFCRHPMLSTPTLNTPFSPRLTLSSLFFSPTVSDCPSLPANHARKQVFVFVFPSFFAHPGTPANW